MTVLDNVYDKICTFPWLYDSYLCARKRKRFRPDVMEFSDELEDNLFEVQEALVAETYGSGGPYHRFYVKEPKLRLVMSLQFRDRIVQWAIYRLLNPFYDRIFIEDSYACRIGKGSHRAAARLQYWMQQISRKPEKWYYLKLDISKYFYRINHKTLLGICRWSCNRAGNGVWLGYGRCYQRCGRGGVPCIRGNIHRNRGQNRRGSSCAGGGMRKHGG